MNWTLTGWGEGYNYPLEPCVDANRWIMRQRMTHICNRWAKDKTDDIQNAFINGIGYASWENVWGTWNGITPRGGELIRRYGALMRAFQPSVRLLGDSWRPLTPCLLSNVFASSWDGALDDFIFRVFFVVNRGQSLAAGNAFSVTDFPVNGSVYDCYTGKRVTPAQRRHASRGLADDGVSSSSALLPLSIAPGDLGCLAILRVGPPGVPPAWAALMAAMSNLTSVPLASFSDEWTYLLQTMEPPPTKNSSANASYPYPTVTVPAAAAYYFHSKGIEIEGPPGYGVDFQMPWEDHPQREHGRTLAVPELEVDEYLVTNSMWLSYLNSSGFVPADPLNYLRFWTSPTSFPVGTDTLPVTWISLDEAQQFCAHYGRRLPLPWEWQYFAGNGKLFPWGDSTTPPTGAVPNASSDQTMPMPPDTTCCAAGGSPFGVKNTFAHVWQWTSAFVDDHTRAALLVGGSYYRPTGSGWYLRHPRNLREHNKLLTMDDSYDRSGAIGFRCVKEAQQKTSY
jgi:hypothetical protein